MVEWVMLTRRKNPRGTTMTNRITKAVAAAVTVITLATFAAPAEAGWRWHRGRGYGWGVGGLVAGSLVGAAIASSVYAASPYNCRFIEQYDQWGNYLGTRRVCRTW
jgi:hypothetical protein